MASRVFLLSLLAIFAIAPSTHGSLIEIARNVVQSFKERIDRETNPFRNLSSISSFPVFVHKTAYGGPYAAYDVIVKEISLHPQEINFVRLNGMEEHSIDNVDLNIRVTLGQNPNMSATVVFNKWGSEEKKKVDVTARMENNWNGALWDNKIGGVWFSLRVNVDKKTRTVKRIAGCEISYPIDYASESKCEDVVKDKDDRVYFCNALHRTLNKSIYHRVYGDLNDRLNKYASDLSM